MKKSFKVEGLHCPNCAARLEKGLNKLEDVTATVTFATQKLTIEAPDDKFDAIMDQADAICKKLEPDWTIVR